MKKIIFAFTLVLFAAVSMAQITPAAPKTVDPAKAEARKDVKTDLQTLKLDQLALKQAKKSKDATALAAAKQKMQADRATLKTAVQHAKAIGVKHPKGMAKQMAKRRQAAKGRHK